MLCLFPQCHTYNLSRFTQCLDCSYERRRKKNLKQPYRQRHTYLAHIPTPIFNHTLCSVFVPTGFTFRTSRIEFHATHIHSFTHSLTAITIPFSCRIAQPHRQNAWLISGKATTMIHKKKTDERTILIGLISPSYSSELNTFHFPFR